MNKKIAVISLFVLTIALLTTTAWAIQTKTLIFSNTAIGTNGISLAAFLDAQSWTNGTQIPWGTLEAGQTYTKTFTIQNTGTVNFIATMTTQNIPTGWTLTWSQSGNVVPVGGEVQGTLTLITPNPIQTTQQTWTMMITATPTT